MSKIMALIVQKYGGSSVGTLERIKHVAAKIIQTKEQGHDVVVVVSAMQGETDRLINLANNLTSDPHPREYDVLVSTGEQVAMSLLAMALNARNCPARSYTGPQVGILTDHIHTKARIVDVKTDLLKKDLSEGYVIVAAGFQGINPKGDITTLGRGGSDTTAVALAAALKAQECQIYTDVDGVYTTDPRMISNACLLSHISFEEMLEMASLGAKVLQMRSVELASKHNLPLRVLSTFSNNTAGTLVTFEEKIMQKRLVSGIAFSPEECIISICGVPNRAGIEGYILGMISEANIEIDMIAQNASDKETTDFTFTQHRKDYMKSLNIMQKIANELGACVKSNAKVAKLSLVGVGMRSHTGVASKMFQALGNIGVNIQMITTSEIKISVIIDESHLEQSVKAVHEAFELSKLSGEKQQVLMET
jgi:aspartate kinase